MSDNIFIDTNVIVYARVRNDAVKHEKAKSLFITHAKDNIFISTQVLSESYNAIRKNGVGDVDIYKTIDECIAKMNVLPVDVDTIRQCFKIKDRYGFSYWDSLILSSALLSDCSVVYSEDMQHEQVIKSKVKIINPFID